jgi:tRNA threonylcarbamoyladenosine biosynthesis protein TsaE
VVDVRRSKLAGERGAAGRSRAESPLARGTVYSLGETETLELGRTIGRALKGGELILLEGDLGLGKTILAKGIAQGLGISPDEVTSPSFTLVQEYRGGRMPVFHVDLYRLDVPEDVGTLGIEEILAAGGVVMVEWGEKLPPYLKSDAVTIRLRDVGEGSRHIEILPAAGRTRTRGDA